MLSKVGRGAERADLYRSGEWRGEGPPIISSLEPVWFPVAISVGCVGVCNIFYGHAVPTFPYFCNFGVVLSSILMVVHSIVKSLVV